MLFEWQKQVEKFIPTSLPGYDFVCRVPVFIPVQEIGLTVWERRVQGLSFIHECVLSAVILGTKSLSDLSIQFGVPENIMLQIVAQLDTEQLAAVSAGNIVLTESGRQVLKNQQKVKILRHQFSRIFINQVTGEISDTPFPRTYREPPRGQTYLQEVYPITLDFLRSKFNTLATIYRESRLANMAFHPGMTGEAELYRILDITYQTLSYVQDYCFVYLNQEDKSLAFRFHSGIHAYEEALLEQINRHELGAYSLLSQPARFCTSDRDIEQLPSRLIEAVRSHNRQCDRLADIEEAYYCDRPLLDGEAEDILFNCAAFKVDRIFIEAPYLSEFLTETSVSALLSHQTKEIIIHYSQDDFQAKRIITRLQKQIKSQENCKLTLQAVQSVSSVKLLFGNTCAIQGQYICKETVYRRRLYKLCAKITFASDQIEALWESVFP